ncbi:hypothetical protein Cni_G11306 [Canna indica]|uniref:Protein TIFY n=1 Tax=Canna indica TaxID=4628 RepID=A0AAQ3K5W2_9LILI|nr:hypothetical protein Cni_G11306 [Canna indica]
MERDFMGLEYGKGSVAMQQQECNRSLQDSSPGYQGGSVQWPYANETSSPPQALSTKAAEGYTLKWMTTEIDSDTNKSYPLLSSQNSLNLIRGDSEQHLMQVNPYLINSSAAYMHYLDDSTRVGATFEDSSSRNTSIPSQLTMFYGGAVIVYDNVSMDTAQEIMLLARNGNGVTSGTSANPRAQMVNAVHASLESHDQAPAPDQLIPRAVPLARKASLSRFLETRKQRMTDCTPHSFGYKITQDTDDGFCGSNSSDEPRTIIPISGHENSNIAVHYLS